MSKLFTVNNKQYATKPFDFNLLCDLEDMGVSIEQAQERPMSMVRAYFGVCTGRGKEYAGIEIAEHVKNGGSLDVLLDAMNYEMENSDFFRSLGQEPEVQKKTTKGKSKTE